jgi:hypothetical protein
MNMEISADMLEIFVTARVGNFVVIPMVL